MIAASKSAKPSSASTDLHETIRHRAEEIYRRNGNLHGCDLANWAQAEAELLGDSVGPRLPTTAIVVKVNGIQYVGEYDPESSLGYLPGEFQTGALIPVRFQGDKMYIQRANGVELETTIVVIRDLVSEHSDGDRQP
jgi:hypothetical protein